MGHKTYNEKQANLENAQVAPAFSVNLFLLSSFSPTPHRPVNDFLRIRNAFLRPILVP
jgi:hypothetical protein